jgi:hypothetical protein
MAIGDGLYSLLGPSTPTAKWIGYQIVSGCGNGLGSTIVSTILSHVLKLSSRVSQPIIALQNTLPASEISIAMAVLIFCQNFGGAIFLAFAEAVFSNSLKKLLTEYVPGVPAETIIAAGATGWRSIVPENQADGVFRAYGVSIDRTFYLAIGTSLGTMVFACCMGWVDIRKKKDIEPNA